MLHLLFKKQIHPLRITFRHFYHIVFLQSILSSSVHELGIVRQNQLTFSNQLRPFITLLLPALTLTYLQFAFNEVLLFHVFISMIDGLTSAALPLLAFLQTGLWLATSLDGEIALFYNV